VKLSRNSHTLVPGRSFYRLSFRSVFRWTLCLRISVPQGINEEVSAGVSVLVSEWIRESNWHTHTNTHRLHPLGHSLFRLNDTAPKCPFLHLPRLYCISRFMAHVFHVVLNSKRDAPAACVCVPVLFTSSFSNAHAGQKERETGMRVHNCKWANLPLLVVPYLFVRLFGRFAGQCEIVSKLPPESMQLRRR